MKKYLRTTIVFVILIALGLSYYFYLSNRENPIDSVQQSIVDEEMARLTTKEIMANYPQTPREVIKLYASITKAYYASKISDENMQKLGKQARLLFDNELKSKQTEQEFLEALKADISKYNSLNRYISDFKVDSSSNVVYNKIEGKEYASITVVYYVREGKGLTTTYHSYKLRKDTDGNWKILYWELTGSKKIQDD